MVRSIFTNTLILLAVPLVASAAETASDKARRLLDAEGRAKTVLAFLHMGTQYDNHTLTAKGDVTGADGKKIPGAFYLEYTYDWKVAGDYGRTTLSFFFNANGRFTHTQVDKTNAEFNKPFFAANLAIAVLGAAVTEALKDDLTDAQFRFLNKLIREADAKGLMDFALAFELARNR